MTTVDRSLLAHTAASATSPLEAAVVLESGGLHDRAVARERAGHDVFDLAERLLLDPRRGVSEPVPTAAATPAGPVVAGRRWFHARGLIYAVPALVALSLLPAGDPTAAGLLLAGLLAAWASGYGVTSAAWSYLGNLDEPGAHRFLRRALVGGIALAAVASCAAVLAVLLLTSTMAVDLTTVAILTGQAAYVLGAVALLMCGKEPWLLAALVPAAAGALLTLLVPALDSGLAGPAVSVVLTVVLGLVATRRAARPRAGLPASAWREAATQVGQGLFVAILVVFPAIDQLVHPGYDPLPQSVTVVALPLVLCMGLAESLALDFRRRTLELLAHTASRSWFARRAGRAALRAHGVIAAVLAGSTGVLCAVAMLVAGQWEGRLVLLGVDYVVLGVALFATTVLAVLGRGDRVLAVLVAGTVALAAYLAHPTDTPSTTTALLWHLGTNLAMLVALGVLVARSAGTPVRHR